MAVVSVAQSHTSHTATHSHTHTATTTATHTTTTHRFDRTHVADLAPPHILAPSVERRRLLPELEHRHQPPHRSVLVHPVEERTPASEQPVVVHARGEPQHRRTALRGEKAGRPRPHRRCVTPRGERAEQRRSVVGRQHQRRHVEPAELSSLGSAGHARPVMHHAPELSLGVALGDKLQNGPLVLVVACKLGHLWSPRVAIRERACHTTDTRRRDQACRQTYVKGSSRRIDTPRGEGCGQAAMAQAQQRPSHSHLACC